MGRSTTVVRWAGALGALVVAALVVASALTRAGDPLPAPVQVAVGAVAGGDGDGGVRQIEPARVVADLDGGTSNDPALAAGASGPADPAGATAADPATTSAPAGSTLLPGLADPTLPGLPAVTAPTLPATTDPTTVDPLGQLLESLPLIGTTTSTTTPTTAPSLPLPFPLPPLPLPLPGGG